MKPLVWVGRLVSLHRRWFAALLAGLAAWSLYQALQTPAPPGETVVVASRDIPAGEVVTESDLTVTQLPTDALPEDYFQDQQVVVGQSTGYRISARSILQPGMFAERAQADTGRSIVPITVDDDSLRSSLVPGTTIWLVVDDGTGAEVLTREAVVVAEPVMEESGFSTQSEDAILLVDVPESLAPEVATLGQQGMFSFILAS